MITNATAPIAAADDIRDIKPPIEISDGLAWLWWGLAALATIVVLFLIWRWWQKRRAQIVFVPPVPAHVRADHGRISARVERDGFAGETAKGKLGRIFAELRLGEVRQIRAG